MLLTSIGGFILIILELLLRGFVLMKLWAWFVVSYFDIQPISYIVAAGVVVIYQVITGLKMSSDDMDLDFGEMFGATLLSASYTILLLGVGWTLHVIMVT